MKYLIFCASTLWLAVVLTGCTDSRPALKLKAENFCKCSGEELRIIRYRDFVFGLSDFFTADFCCSGGFCKGALNHSINRNTEVFCE